MNQPRICRLYEDYWGEVPNVGLEVFTAVIMIHSIFWDKTPCSLSKLSRGFEWTYPLHNQSYVPEPRIFQSSRKSGVGTTKWLEISLKLWPL
jgi:G:T-mismatch repair DNA endonuclease (very short patch repair protein)